MRCIRSLLLAGLMQLVACSSSHLVPDRLSSHDYETCRRLIFGDVLDLRESGARLVVSLRILDEFDLERQAMVIERKEGYLEVGTMSIVGESIDVQIGRATSRRSGITIGEACSAVAVKKSEWIERDSAELKDLISDLREMRISPVPEAPFVVHGNQYELTIFSENSYGISWFMGVPESPETGSSLQAWADRFLKVVKVHSEQKHVRE